MHIVAIAPTAWGRPWMNRQHLTWALKEHAPVLYVQEPHAWHKGWRCRDERFFRRQIVHKHERLSVLRLPKCLCRRGGSGRWNRTTFSIKSKQIRNHLPRDAHSLVLYLWHPQLWSYTQRLRPDVKVFHVYDLLPQFHLPEYRGTSLQLAFLQACRQADLVIAGTTQQAEFIPADNVAVVPNAAPVDWYLESGEEPEAISAVPHPRLGYVGTISDKLELSWLERLADVSEWHVVLVGPVGRLSKTNFGAFRQLCARPNVHYLGEMSAEQVPAHVKALDVGLMNYTRGRHCDSSSPLKLYEYCAAGLPIVGSRLPSLVQNAEASRFVELVDTGEQAVAAVRRLLDETGTDVQRQKRREFAQRNSWAERARVVVELIRTRLAARKGRPVSEIGHVASV